MITLEKVTIRPMKPRHHLRLGAILQENEIPLLQSFRPFSPVRLRVSSA
ncbi:hypothetical protein [Pedobacter sp.]